MNVNRIHLRLVLFFLLLLPARTFAQSAQTATVTDVTQGLHKWIKGMNTNVDKYFSQDRGAELYDRLEELKFGLSGYLKTRKTLSDSLIRHNAAPGKRDNNALESLKIKMSTVMAQMRGISNLVSEDLRAEGDKLNDEIYNAIYSEQPRFLSHLEAFLAGMEVSKKDLAVESVAAYDRLTESVSLITDLQGKLNRKLKK
ncbi:hypothetical protein [Chitinophaga barathri]|uniref:TerB family tellurite resistance protein n=1 Tax=Chitinophaga barathri TaxID=1647451 RepID=A0A3N4M6S7_9BACT|nr:hypothetical protein [Chitinophaga barathri]RPD38991.1 hypothetical protein EG028_22910 [Chitinophaga barathri]